MLEERDRLLRGLLLGFEELPVGIDLLVIPPFTALPGATQILAASRGRIMLGAQDLHWEPKGAYTGEVSGAMLREVGCAYVLVGHSERRSYFNEDDLTLCRKLEAALREGLTPILCVGEQLPDREGGRTELVLDQQIDATLLKLGPPEVERLVLAYEPVWAIGTGLTATPEQAEAVHRHLRDRVGSRMGRERAESLQILYGGSVNPGNAADLLEQPDIDGALVGGASLKAADFLAIARAADRTAGA